MIPAPRRRRRSAPSTASRRPWRTPVLALSLLINLTAVGYRLTEGWDWGDCYWMVVVTLSTMGWSDGTTQPLSTAGRVVTTLAIVGGLVVVQVTIQSLLGLSESGYFRRLRERRFKNWLSMMENHVILCGYGRIGREIADQLVSEGVPLVVVEMDTAQKEAAEERGLPVLQADATLDETLVEAGIHHCRSLVAALPNNAANLYVVLSARGIAPRCRLIARSDSEEAARKLRLAGADQVVSPYVAGGRTMAATALRPLAVGFMELLAGSDCEVEEFQLTDDPQRMVSINGRSLAELQLGRQTGVLVLAIRQPAPAEPVISYYRGVAYREDQPRLIANPGSDLRLAPGQLLVVLGSKEQLARFGKLLGPALVSMDAMER
ncbi:MULTISPECIES: TrkA family potassium uptake protein [unclassified Synechococcus]|uniref:potassium channel family protein n=1 Tax=unclassified Synechococcus TaxID=2626047 RepID=UPI000B98A658|nr:MULTISPECIES: potassium channel protein [unclassified Synechococcus]MCP9827572.1 potassium channel protein [Synechococcus sp. L2F]MCP9847207.1 potassium channel protein [Synechococcus sp. Lug-A]